VCMQNLKSVALPVPEIIYGVLEKNGQSLDTPTLPYLRTFSWAVIQMDTVVVPVKFEDCSFTRSQDNSDWSFGWDVNLQSWGRGGRRGAVMVLFERAKVSSYRLPIA